MNTDLHWTAVLIAQLTELWMRVPRMSTIAIGIEMRLTKNQVVGKAHRLLLPPRASPIAFRSQPREKKPRKYRAAVVIPSVVVAAVVCDVTSSSALGEDDVTGFVVAEAVGPTSAQDSEVRPSLPTVAIVAWVEKPVQRSPPKPCLCGWPMWGYRARPTHVYCGQAIELGRLYCPDHNKVAFVKIPLPARAA